MAYCLPPSGIRCWYRKLHTTYQDFGFQKWSVLRWKGSTWIKCTFDNSWVVNELLETGNWLSHCFILSKLRILKKLGEEIDLIYIFTFLSHMIIQLWQSQAIVYICGAFSLLGDFVKFYSIRHLALSLIRLGLLKVAFSEGWGSNWPPSPQVISV